MRTLAHICGPVVAVSDLTESIRRSHVQYENANGIKDDFCADCVEEWPCDAIRAADRIDQLETEATLRECTVKLAEWIVDDANAKAEIDRRTDVEGWPHD